MVFQWQTVSHNQMVTCQSPIVSPVGYVGSLAEVEASLLTVGLGREAGDRLGGPWGIHSIFVED